jgi:hypothetical protein
LPLKHLYYSLCHLFGVQRQIDSTHGLFTKIIHLELFGGLGGSFGNRTMETDSPDPALTHLSFSDGVEG